MPEALRHFLDRVGRLDHEEVRALSAWKDDSADLERGLARRTAQRALRASRRKDPWREVVAGLQAWAGRPRDFVPWGDRAYPTPEWHDVDAMEVRMRALPHLLDAAAALMLADRLSPQEAEALSAPWRSVLGDR